MVIVVPMSAKCDGYEKVKIYPKNMKRLRRIRQTLSFPTSITAMVNTALEVGMDTMTKDKPKNK